jgi:hypothetical protein
MDQKNKEILIATFAQMPDFFTSREFTTKLRENKYAEQLIKNGCSYFLHQNAIQQEGSRRMWKKNGVRIDKIQEAIDLLKSQGYKVMKQITEYREL